MRAWVGVRSTGAALRAPQGSVRGPPGRDGLVGGRCPARRDGTPARARCAGGCSVRVNGPVRVSVVVGRIRGAREACVLSHHVTQSGRTPIPRVDGLMGW